MADGMSQYTHRHFLHVIHVEGDETTTHSEEAIAEVRIVVP